jgi:aquaporin Z
LDDTLRRHWPEYLIEAAGLGLFMLMACVVVAALEYPASPLHELAGPPLQRRALTGIAMGMIAVALIYSPWGQRSGAHLNPALTLIFWRLGKIEPRDALGYVAAQFAGAIAGVAVATGLIGAAVMSHPAVGGVVTVPGARGWAVAFAAETGLAFGMMGVVLVLGNSRRTNRWTGAVAGTLLALYITVAAPLSGMSMNPARTFGTALWAQVWTAIWVYFTAPLLGMGAAAAVYVRLRGASAVLCCKLHHDNRQHCIFRCRWGEAYREMPPEGMRGPA